jgi:hypothetical protein
MHIRIIRPAVAAIAFAIAITVAVVAVRHAVAVAVSVVGGVPLTYLAVAYKDNVFWRVIARSSRLRLFTTLAIRAL